MEFFKMKKTKSYYEGEIAMFDGIMDGQNVYTFLTNVVLVRTKNDLYMNAKTEEEYFAEEKDIEIGDVVCRVKDPLPYVTDEAAVDQYILNASGFFKDRLAIYENLPFDTKMKFQMNKENLENITKDRKDLKSYHQIIKEQGPIVRAYEKMKR